LTFIPNFITFLRLLAAPLLGWLIVHQRFDQALLTTIPIGLSDWLDGTLARRFHAQSQLGLVLDPAADKTLLVTSYACLAIAGQIPLWLFCLVIGRDLVIVVGVFLLWKLRGYTKFKPVMTGKVSTSFQIFTIFLVLLMAAFPGVLPSFLRDLSFVLTAVFTFISGAGYVRKGIHMASRHVTPATQNSPQL
jgi:cardiolipin synthase (CMP-forming)